jgi:hypothetical protein
MLPHDGVGDSVTLMTGIVGDSDSITY